MKNIIKDDMEPVWKLIHKIRANFVNNKKKLRKIF